MLFHYRIVFHSILAFYTLSSPILYNSATHILYSILSYVLQCLLCILYSILLCSKISAMYSIFNSLSATCATMHSTPRSISYSLQLYHVFRATFHCHFLFFFFIITLLQFLLFIRHNFTSIVLLLLLTVLYL